ncbi:TPA: hypothetical protein EYP83_04335 [Candidatus Geothermarchaeota archaeon]|nr:hypothetical protein [Candidatus Geothermarchaeota archaeon]HIQ13301.1 hypothetical protein [Thermoprotei archaeon]
MSRDIFYVDIRYSPRYGQFITVYDKDVKERHEVFKDKTYTKIVNKDELIQLFKSSISIILYGKKCIEIGIKERFIHPDAVAKQYGVEVAIYIDTRRS